MESRAARALSCVAVACAVAGLAVDLLPTSLPTVLDAPSLQLVGLVSAALLGLALLAPRERRSRGVLVGLSLVPAAVVVADSAFGPESATDVPGPWAAVLVLVVLMLGAAVLAPERLGRLEREVLAVLTGLTVSIWLLLHLVATPDSYLSHVADAVPVPVTLVVGLLSLAVLLEVPDGTLRWASGESDPGAVLVRVVMPLVLLGVPGAGVARRWLEDQGLEQGAASALMTSATTVLLGGLVLGTGLRLRALHLDRVQTDEELRTLLRDLDDRVRRRAATREQRSVRLALSSDRERIARDLHDRVIQRVFAAGLRLDAFARREERLAPDIGEVVGQLDLAITELRESIEALNAADESVGWEPVRAEAMDAASVLGTAPVVVTPDRADGVSPEVLSEAAVVVRELLSNVARHARASETVVVVEVLDGDVVLSVSDDGVGMPDHASRRSGVANVRTRAVALGGDAVWSRRPEGGTTVVWSVPAGRPVTEDWLQGLS